MADDYTPSEEHMSVAWIEYDDAAEDINEAEAEFDRFIAKVRRDAAREALDGLSEWLGELAEKHPARSAHVPLMQGHITRYTTPWEEA